MTNICCDVIYFVCTFFRKDVLPIENEPGEEISSNSDVEEEGQNRIETAEEIIARMVRMKKDFYQSAKDNIVKAQRRYKRDYDKKHCKGKVCLYFIS